jgi:hypothetical protein
VFTCPAGDGTGGEAAEEEKMKRSVWRLMGLGLVLACTLALPGGCRKDAALEQETPAETEPAEREPAEKEPDRADPPDALFAPSESEGAKPWGQSAFELEASLEAEPDVPAPGGRDGL